MAIFKTETTLDYGALADAVNARLCTDYSKDYVRKIHKRDLTSEAVLTAIREIIAAEQPKGADAAAA